MRRPPRTITPRRETRDKPDTIATGAASNSGHGVATKHRHRTLGRSAPQPCRPGDQERQWEEPLGQAIGETHDGSTGGGGFTGQPDDARIGAVVGTRRGPDLDRPPALIVPLRASCPVWSST